MKLEVVHEFVDIESKSTATMPAITSFAAAAFSSHGV
jgi:hypothetical protein